MILGILITTAATGQTLEISDSQRNKINATFDSRYPGVDINSIEWENDAEGNIVGSFLHNDREMTATFDKEGSWVSSAETVRLNDLPKDFRNNLTIIYGNKRISAVQRINNRDNQVLYDVHVAGKDTPVRYDQDGALYDQVDDGY